jgi:carboxyl-terminal processing protease
LTPEVATLHRVPAWSAAHAAGARPGWTLEGIDGADWLARTGAPPHAKAWTAGRRAIALNGVAERAFTAAGPNGERAEWVERPEPPALDRVIAWRAIDARTGYLRLANWFAGIGLEDAVDAALTELRGRERLVLDLQGNTGGNLVLATGIRDRFLRERTLLGTIRFSTGDGNLADPVPMWSEPARERVRWAGDLVVLTDPLTYSASEDALLGLRGLPHVTVIGQRSGGGSGRPRTITLTDDVFITISTALTFDRDGTCIENHGVPVDIETPAFALDGSNPALERALGPDA